MNEQIEILTDEKFKEIYTDDKLRHEVAYAHWCCNSRGEHEYLKALMHPVSYKVTEEQKEEALRVLEENKKKVLSENKNNLLFCGMGMNFKPEIPDGVWNYRIRTHFINDDGVNCFIEFGKSCRMYKEKPNIYKKNLLRIDHALIYYENKENEKNNYKRLEIEPPELPYTFENILYVVNKYFNCSFKKVVLDYYNIHCDGVLCISPKEVKNG